MDKNNIEQCDVVLIGAGIMSATLGVMLKELDPTLNIKVYERLETIAAESSDAWNNAGTGHSALCELNYTTQKEDGSIDISKAIKIMEQFEITKQFWTYFVENNYLEANDFIHSIPHISCVFGEEDVDFLKKRYDALNSCHLFSGMEFTDKKETLKEWFPLMMEGRSDDEKIASTKSTLGTDVNFGDLTRNLFHHLQNKHQVEINLNYEVKDIERGENNTWTLKIENENIDKTFKVNTKFVFVGAGGGALNLLNKSDIEEGKGFAGFPVAGQWLVCKNEAIINAHQAKVYGKAKVGSPPMSVPHLDTRIINGKKELLFGPFAGFSTKFLKEGSYLDLPLSINIDNIVPMIGAGLNNLSLTKYLITQVLQSFEDKMDDLRAFIPSAKADDWELLVAGQRVQVIKKDEEEGGILEFGTEVVADKEGTIAALLGASPGASTAVSIMLEVLKKGFAENLETENWQQKLKEMIPSYGKYLLDEPILAQKIRTKCHEVLGLQ